MEGFYTKEEAAQILGVSYRTVTTYIMEGKIRIVKSKKRSYIPVEDIHCIFDGLKKNPVPSRAEFDGAMARIDDMERTIEILKNSLGFQGRRNRMTEKELFLFRQEVFLSLSKKSWNVRRISKAATDLMSFSSEEISKMIHLHGMYAWKPFLALSRRMINYLSNHKDYPNRGLGSLHDRLIKSQNRFLGLIYSSRYTETNIQKGHAEELLRSLETPPSDVSKFILEYVRDTIN